VLNALVEAGSDIAAADRHGSTLLMWAAGYGRTEVVKRLLELGADRRALNDKGKTAADIARDGGHSAVEALLLSDAR